MLSISQSARSTGTNVTNFIIYNVFFFKRVLWYYSGTMTCAINVNVYNNKYPIISLCHFRFVSSFFMVYSWALRAYFCERYVIRLRNLGIHVSCIKSKNVSFGSIRNGSLKTHPGISRIKENNIKLVICIFVELAQNEVLIPDLLVNSVAIKNWKDFSHVHDEYKIDDGFSCTQNNKKYAFIIQTVMKK